MLGVFLDRDTVDAGDMDLSPLEEALPEWEFYGRTVPEQTTERIAAAQVVVANKVALDADTLADAQELELVCVAATGTNNVDLEAAHNLGITVSNVAGYSTPSVVQMVFAMMLALHSRLPEHRQAVRAGRWSQSPQFCMLDFPFHELKGRTLGIVGHGTIGQAVAKVARAFGMKVLVAQRPGGQDKRARRVPLDKVLARADVLSLHCPLTPATEGLIGAAQLRTMKAGSLLLNTARGGIVDEAALADALRDGHLGGAGVDVLPAEPPPPDHPLLAQDIPHLIVTPHIAWASREARQRLVNELAANIRAWRRGTARNVVGTQPAGPV